MTYCKKFHIILSNKDKGLICIVHEHLSLLFWYCLMFPQDLLHSGENNLRLISIIFGRIILMEQNAYKTCNKYTSWPYLHNHWKCHSKKKILYLSMWCSIIPTCRYETNTNFSNTKFILFLNPTAIFKKVNKNIRNGVAINNT